MRTAMIFCLCTFAPPASADAVLALMTLRPKEVVRAEAVILDGTMVPGAATALEDVIGKEVKRAVYAGQPVLASNITEAALVERNQVVAATFTLRGLTIGTEARVLERGSAGDIIRAMNLTSRTTIRAEVLEDGRLKVLP
ncbi:flagellar basal body P-ring formation chaperone FlgA [Marivita sp.]|uniref:flagellar basal body P-ring formation chaperone FlgA n=1 Tax=Marivita sp. TaxID=2003365 RepID=UPI0025BEE238|nr:flagellar basal body P-ring formation chaperone FlgA [Marivita sp.]